MVDTLFDLEGQETVIVIGLGEASMEGCSTNARNIRVDNVAKHLELSVMETIVFTLEKDFLFILVELLLERLVEVEHLLERQKSVVAVKRVELGGGLEMDVVATH